MTSRFKGYTGKILDIDLTSRTIGTYALSDRDRERFLGGRFISTKILWDQMAPGVDPLSQQNILVIMTDQQKATASHLYGNTLCHTPSMALQPSSSASPAPGTSTRSAVHAASCTSSSTRSAWPASA